MCRYSHGFLVGDEHFDLVESFFSTSGMCGSGFAVSRAGVWAGNVNLLPAAARGLRRREVGDENDPLAGQH